MKFIQGQLAVAAAASVLTLVSALTGGVARAQDKTFVMKITTPTIHAVLDQYGAAFGAAVEKDTGGRIKVEVYPASQLGSIPRQIEGTQFGAIQCAIIPPEFFVGIDERLKCWPLPASSPPRAGPEGRRRPGGAEILSRAWRQQRAAWRRRRLRRASEVISKDAIRHVADFKGKKLRIFASEFQSVCIQAAWHDAGGDVAQRRMTAIQQGSLDSAVAGVQLLSGLHFYDAAKYITMTNHAAIFNVVEISKKWYDSLPPDLQQIIDRDAASTALNFNPRAHDIEDAAVKAWTAAAANSSTCRPTNKPK